MVASFVNQYQGLHLALSQTTMTPNSIIQPIHHHSFTVIMFLSLMQFFVVDDQQKTCRKCNSMKGKRRERKEYQHFLHCNILWNIDLTELSKESTSEKRTKLSSAALSTQALPHTLKRWHLASAVLINTFAHMYTYMHFGDYYSESCMASQT